LVVHFLIMYMFMIHFILLLFLQHEAGKKRAAESFMLKTPLSDKKAKVATPSAQKTGVPLNILTKLSLKIV
jgi:hypothetical protein